MYDINIFSKQTVINSKFLQTVIAIRAEVKKLLV